MRPPVDVKKRAACGYPDAPPARVNDWAGMIAAPAGPAKPWFDLISGGSSDEGGLQQKPELDPIRTPIVDMADTDLGPEEDADDLAAARRLKGLSDVARRAMGLDQSLKGQGLLPGI
jgi:hypothetical protein